MIVITFLGTVSGIPSRERGHPAIVLEYLGKTKDTLLFDCGEGTQSRLMRSGISFMDVDWIFITHWHADHFAGLTPLLQTMSLEKRGRRLRVYGPEAERFMACILNLGYFGLRFPIDTTDLPFQGREITPVVETADWQVSSIPVWHSVPTVAYCFKERDRWAIQPERLRQLGLRRGRWLRRLKSEGEAVYKGRQIRIEEVAQLKPGLKVVYTGDTRPCRNVIKIAQGADLLIHDGTFLEQIDTKAHADVTQAAEIARRAGVKQLILTHISRRYVKVKELEEEARKIFPNTQIAHDFMRIELRG
jgi:ribonuclease Z